MTWHRALLLALLLVGIGSVPGDAVTPMQRKVLLSSGQPHIPGFLYGVNTVFDTTNILRQSNSFTTTPWTTFSSGGAVTTPVLTANQTTDPIGGNNGWKMHLPAVSGVHAYSVLGNPDLSAGVDTGAPPPIACALWVKGALGTETIWIMSSGASGVIISTKVSATTSWQRYSVVWNVGDTGTVYFEIGVNLFDGGQTATIAQDVFVYQSQCTQGTQPQSDIITAGAAVTVQTTKQSPVPFRDFSTLTKFGAGTNPITAQNGAAWNSGGTDSPKIWAAANIGGTFFGPAEGNNGTSGGGGWNNIGCYTAPAATPLVWTVRGAIISRSLGTWYDHYTLHPTAPIRIAAATPFWIIYFSGQDTGSNSTIGYATTTDDPPNCATSVWTVGASPVISGIEQALPSTPIITNGLLVMYVSMQNHDTSILSRVINYYTSPHDGSANDGKVWTLAGTALYSSTADWDTAQGGKVYDAFVFRNSHGWCEMVYTALQSPGSAFFQQVGYGVSPDCLGTWYKWQAAPILAGINGNFPGDNLLYETPSTLYFFTATTFGCNVGGCGSAVTNGDAYSMANHLRRQRPANDNRVVRRRRKREERAA